MQPLCHHAVTLAQRRLQRTFIPKLVQVSLRVLALTAYIERGVAGRFTFRAEIFNQIHQLALILNTSRYRMDLQKGLRVDWSRAERASPQVVRLINANPGLPGRGFRLPRSLAVGPASPL